MSMLFTNNGLNAAGWYEFVYNEAVESASKVGARLINDCACAEGSPPESARRLHREMVLAAHCIADGERNTCTSLKRQAWRSLRSTARFDRECIPA